MNCIRMKMKDVNDERRYQKQNGKILSEEFSIGSQMVAAGVEFVTRR